MKTDVLAALTHIGRSLPLSSMGDYYAAVPSEYLYLPTDITHTHFRFFFDGRAMKIKDIVYTKDQLIHLLSKWSPTDVFYTPSKFLDPTVLAKKSDKLSQNLFLYSDEFLIDLDFPDFEEGKSAVIKLLDYLKMRKWDPSYVCFSGSKGWHVSLPFDYRSSNLDPRQRELETKQIKSTIIETIAADMGLPTLGKDGYGADTIVSWDTRRIVRLPGTIHGKTGNLVEIINPEDISKYQAKHLVDIEKGILLRDRV